MPLTRPLRWNLRQGGHSCNVINPDSSIRQNGCSADEQPGNQLDPILSHYPIAELENRKKWPDGSPIGLGRAAWVTGGTFSTMEA